MMPNDLNNPTQGKKIHKILAFSYLTYFLAFLLGLIFDFLFPYHLFNNPYSLWIGVLFMFFGSVLIFWAQKTSKNLAKENINKESFNKGPYAFTRNPTHLGIFFLMIGFALVTATIFIVLFTLLAYLITKHIFLKKEEEILSQKYGSAYLEYKDSVKF